MLGKSHEFTVSRLIGMEFFFFAPKLEAMAMLHNINNIYGDVTGYVSVV